VLWMLGCAVAVAGTPPAPPPPPAAPPAAAPGAPFSHDEHASRKVVIDRCEACHGVDASGQVILPTAIGHSPCLSEGCHASDFAGVSATVRKANPALYARAIGFCQGCHVGKDGAPPLPWLKPMAIGAVRSFQHEPEYHVEMNHYDHTQRADCLSCHIVDNKSFAIVPSAPGHTQCVACHNAQKFPAFTMANCGVCHDKPGRAEFFRGTRPQVDVRACGSEGHAALEMRLRHPVPCFRHEQREHRFVTDTPIQCGACHYMVGDKSKWGMRRYQSLLDLRTGPIIDNSQDRQHKSCGQATACHSRDVDAARAGARCSLCHAEQTEF
jgi:hypothetical protein